MTEQQAFWPPQQTPEPSKPNNTLRSVLLVIFAVTLIAVIAGIIWITSSKSSEDQAGDLTQAAQDCSASQYLSGDSVWELNEVDANTAYFDLLCMETTTGMPLADQDRVENTTALSGVQTSTWDGYSASWTYNGIDETISFTLRSE